MSDLHQMQWTMYRGGQLADEGQILSVASPPLSLFLGGVTVSTNLCNADRVERFWQWLERQDYDQERQYLRYGLEGGYVSEAMHTDHGVAREFADGQRVLFVDVVDYYSRDVVASLLLV